MNAEAAPRRRRLHSGGRLIVLLVGALSLGIALSGIAYAYWSTRGAGTATVTTGTLNPPTNVTGSSTGANTASISWTAPTGTPGATGYDVVRTNTGNGTTANVCGTPATHVTTTSCTDTAVAAGTYTYRVTAIYRSWTAQSAASNAVTVLVATQLAFTTQPSTAATAGSAFTVQPVVKVQDANGNTAGSDTSVVTLALTNASGATLTCTGGNAVTAAAGMAAFAGCSVDKSGTYTLTATDGSLTSAVSTSVTVSAGAATQLAFVQQPANTASTAAITPAVTVKLLDQFGNLTSSAASVTVAIGTNPVAGTLSGRLAQTASSGVATFNNLSIDKAGTGYTLTAASPGLAGATSNTFNISVGTAAKLVFTQQPSGATAHTAFTTQPKVAVTDAGGNIVTTDTSTVSLAKTIGAGPGTLSGCSATATNGTTTFTGCKIDTVGTGYTLTATDGSLTLAVSAAFNVTAGAPAKLVFTQQPSNATGGTALATQPKVAVQDANGNIVSSDTSAITLAIGSVPGATLSCTANPTNAVSGIAAFAGCSINKAGTYTLTATDGALAQATSASFSVTAGAPAKLVFTQTVAGNQSATATATIGPFAVQAQDSLGNPVTASSAVTLALTSVSSGTKFFTTTSGGTSAAPITIPSGASTSRTFYYADTKAATPTLTASGTVNGIVMTPATTNVDVVAASASVMAFVNCSVPSGNDGCTGQPIAMSNNNNMTLNITLLDAFNNPAVAATTVTITLTNSDGTFSFGTGGATASVATGSGTSTQIVLHHGVNGGTDTLTAHVAAGGFSDITLQAKK